MRFHALCIEALMFASILQCSGSGPLVLFGSQTGAAEDVADHLSHQLRYVSGRKDTLGISEAGALVCTYVPNPM